MAGRLGKDALTKSPKLRLLMCVINMQTFELGQISPVSSSARTASPASEPASTAPTSVVSLLLSPAVASTDAGPDAGDNHEEDGDRRDGVDQRPECSLQRPAVLAQLVRVREHLKKSLLCLFRLLQQLRIGRSWAAGCR